MLKNIYEIAKKLEMNDESIEPYGMYKAKIDLSKLKISDRQGSLVLVTAITPTKAGEGKTTTSIALADGMAKIGENAILALREPSLGPVFGLKGGATGGGKVTVEPKEDINLHFTGDMHALTSSINLIAAVIDNSIYQENPLNINPLRIVWKRALDMNDRALREVIVGLGKGNGTERKDEFVITVASELMAIMCLAANQEEFKKMVGNITVAYTFDELPVKVKDLRIVNAIMKLMKEALKPNLVQTNENNPALIHGGPFANIAHGCNSIIATKLGLRLADYVITEAGFGSDLGAEKFLDIKCQRAGLSPKAVVLVATIRALKLHGGVDFDDLDKENVEALTQGVSNLKKHAENMKKYGVGVIIAINHFASDSEREIAFLSSWCENNKYQYSFLDGFIKGGDGATDLARKVVALIKEGKSSYHSLVNKSMSVKEKIETICTQIYGAKKVEYSELAIIQLENYYKLGYEGFDICMAKTPLSLSDNPKKLNVPTGFTITIREINCSSGAEFLIPLTGKVMTMPGLPKVPAAVKMEDE